MDSNSKHHFLFFAFLIIPGILLQGCQNPDKPRRYHEVFIDTPPKTTSSDSDPHAFMKMMPNDDIHANLRFNDSELQGKIMDSVTSTPLSWTTPQGWLEKKGSGMRLVTFINADDTAPIETTIVSLAGEAGGIAANAIRWIQQLKMPVPSDQELKNFLDSQEKIQTPSGLPMMLMDFTQLQKDAEPTTASMIAAIVEGQQTQIFVKMTGSKQAVLKNLMLFKSLLQSLKVNSAP